MEPSVVDNADVLERLRSRASPARDGEAGAWVVGGAVRDLLLGRPVAGILDVVVEGDAVAVARRAAARVGGRLAVHERFGTATVLVDGEGLDVATARRETYARPGALPDVELGASVEEDLARRDFSVNAIALNLDTGRLRADPDAFGDLRAGLLRVLHERSFVDDPTRLLRLARYSARLGFTAEPATSALALDAVRDGAVSTVTPSRLGAELRLLLQEPLPAALLALENGGLGREVVHPAFAVSAELIARALALSAGSSLAALASTLAGAAPASTLPAPRELAARLDALEFPAGERDTVVAAASRARPLAADLARGPSDRELWRRARGESAETVALAGALEPAAEPAARRWLDELRHRRLEITGDDLVAEGITGPPVGRALEAAMEAALDGRAPDRATQLEAALDAARP
jgi:tRNA nucleotidyltransferase (CCA-adding enzyme)